MHQEITEKFAPSMQRSQVLFLGEQERTDLRNTRDYIVDEANAAPIFANTGRSGIAAVHREMCKLAAVDAAGVRTVLMALKRYVHDFLTVIEARVVRTRDEAESGGEVNGLVDRPSLVACPNSVLTCSASFQHKMYSRRVDIEIQNARHDLTVGRDSGSNDGNHELRSMQLRP